MLLHTKLSKLHEGKFSRVFKGTYPVKEEEKEILVAIKMVDVWALPNLTNIKQEWAFLRNRQASCHPNLVTFYCLEHEKQEEMRSNVYEYSSVKDINENQTIR